MFCSNCGTSNDEGAKFCQKCGKPLGEDAPLGADAPTQDMQVTTIGGGKVSGKNPLLALVLSIIPGVGQFYNGDYKKGGVILGLAILSLVFTPFVVVPLAVVAWSMIDAYRVASGQGRTW